MKLFKSSVTAADIADIVQGKLSGDAHLEVKGLSSIDMAEPQSVTFFGHAKYGKYVNSISERVILVDPSFKPDDTQKNNYIIVDNVYEAVSVLSSLYVDNEEVRVSDRASIHESVQVGKEVSVGDFSIIEKGVILGENVQIGPQVFIGQQVSIGDGSVVHTGVKIMSGVQIGARCIIYPNAVIGSDGFGHAPVAEGFAKIKHLGGVIIEDDVEIGSNCCVDQGSIKSTIIRKGAKLDNLIQVGHGVEIGEHVAIAAQTGISGSSKIGHGSKIGGQVGVVGHVSIAPNSQIQAQSGIASDLKEADQKWYGYPALPYFKFLRSYALFKRLPEFFKRLRRIEELFNQK